MVRLTLATVWLFVVAALGAGENVCHLNAWLFWVDDILAAFSGSLAVIGVAAVACTCLAATGWVA